MNKVKIGIVGCGGIANQKHLPAMKKNSDLCEVVAFCDIIPERAEKAAKEYGVEGAKVYTDYHDLLANPDVEIVHVLTPNVAHCPITVAAFEAGKHVYCEKPMAHNTADAQKMVDAWKKSGKQFTIGYQNLRQRRAGRHLLREGPCCAPSCRAYLGRVPRQIQAGRRPAD